MSSLTKISASLMAGALGLLFAPLAMAVPGTPALTGLQLSQPFEIQTMSEGQMLNSRAQKVGYRVHLGFGGLAGYSEYGNYGGGSSGFPARGYYDQDYYQYRRNEYSPRYNSRPRVRRAPRTKRSRFKRRIRIRPR